MHPLLVPIAKAFAKDKSVVAKTMFSSIALTVEGKIFAMVDSRDRFVVKLPATRVASLVSSGAEPWGPGSGRIMNEWVALPAATKKSWLVLAKEARDFVGSNRRATSGRRAPRREPSRGRRAARSARR